MPDRQLTRAEIAELAGRLHCLLAMIDTGRVTASTRIRFRLQGAVAALEAVLGRTSSGFDPLDAPSHDVA